MGEPGDQRLGPRAIGDFLVLRSLRDSGGTAVAVDEDEVAVEQARLAREAGLLVGPEGAAAMLALRTLVAGGSVGKGERAVVFQTGHPGNYV